MLHSLTNQNINQPESPYVAIHIGVSTSVTTLHTLWLICFLRYIMASPQLENGYLKIANEIMDALIKNNLSGQEVRAILFVIRKTYGFNKKEDYIALRQFWEILGISKTRASQVVNSLGLMKILTVTENLNGKVKKYLFNKDFDKWVIPLRKSVTGKVFRNNRSSIPQQGVTKKCNHKIQYTKYNTTKDIIDFPLWLPLEAFEAFKSMRQKIKKPLTEKAITLAIKKLELLKNRGEEPEEVLNQSIMNCYQGLFEVKDKKKSWED